MSQPLALTNPLPNMTRTVAQIPKAMATSVKIATKAPAVISRQLEAFTPSSRASSQVIQDKKLRRMASRKARGVSQNWLQQVETDKKAKFLSNIFKFIESPNSRTSHDIAVVGDPALAESLREQHAGRRVGGLPVTIREVRDLNQIQEKTPSMLYVDPKVKNASEFLKAAPHGTATVQGSSPKSNSADSHFTLRQGEKGLRFDANWTKSQKSGVKVSTKLLALAKNVIRP